MESLFFILKSKFFIIDEEIQGIMEEVLPEELARWTKADTNEDKKLSLEEFLSFQHPEHNERSIAAMADELISEMDDNGDLVKY